MSGDAPLNREALHTAIRALCPDANPAYFDPILEGVLEQQHIFTVPRAEYFFAQLLHESARFTQLTENLNYTARRLVQVWPRRFPNTEVASHYANNPQALANRVYANRNGNTQPGDGWKYRGRGPLQITGRTNYTVLAKLANLPLIDEPALALAPEHALQIAATWWNEYQKLNVYADRRDFVGLTKRVNGGLIGLADRQSLLSEVGTAYNKLLRG